MMFLKRLSDAFDEAKAYYIGTGKAEAQALELADDNDEYDTTFYIPPIARWSDCTGKSELELNWLITLAPNRMVDYVVIHELYHLIHRDHSPELWREVTRVMPDYQMCREWLRESSEGWWREKWIIVVVDIE